MSKTSVSKLPDTIKADRLFLRAPNMSDAATLQQLANNKSIHAVLARLPFPYTEKHAMDFITNLARTKDEHAYTITTKNSHFIGVAGWHLDRELGLELGYWLGEPYWGKGYATEVARVMVKSALGAGYKKLFARSITANTGSICVLKKAGFKVIRAGIDDCGVHKDIHVTLFEWERENG